MEIYIKECQVKFQLEVYIDNMNIIFELFIISFLLQSVSFLFLFKIYKQDINLLQDDKVKVSFKYSLFLFLISWLVQFFLIINQVFSVLFIHKIINSSMTAF